MAEWTFLTNHGAMLVAIAQQPNARLRELADRVGITERGAHRVISDLVEAGYVSRRRVGRRNAYEVHPELPMRHQLARDHAVGEVLAVLFADRLGGQ